MAKKITIADLFPDDEGMILVAEHAVDGSLRHISEVPNGAACGCICFGCKRRLIAKNGGDPARIAYHFAHRAEDIVIDCTSAGETALHIRAKEIIAKYRRVTLPATSILGLDGKEVEVIPERSVDLTDVRLEAVAGELIPDVTATMPDGRRIFIEIANTHPCSQQKIEKLDAMGVEVLEIMVSAYRDVALDDLDEIILDIAPRKLIHSSEVKTMAAKLAEDRRRQEDAKRAEAERLVAVYRNPVIRNHVKAQALSDDLAQLGLAEFLELDDRPSAFIVYRRQWQAVILDRLYKAKSAFLSPMDLLESFSKGGWPKKEIAYTKSEHSKWIAANIDDDFRSPYEEVSAYLSRLRGEDAVYEARGKGFAMNRDLRLRIDATIEKRTRPQRRIAELKIAFRNIGVLMEPDDGRLPKFDQWLQGRATAVKLSVEELLVDESGYFEGLTERMEAVYRMVADMRAYKKVEQPEDLAGLPMDRLINRLRTARIAEEKREQAEWAVLRRRQEAEAAALQRQEITDRVFRLTEAAIFVVPDVDIFLDTPSSEHDGKTPRQLASESYRGFNQAQAILSTIREAKHAVRAAESLKRDMVGKLWERVYSRIPRREVADLWPKQGWPELDGMKPLEYCKDQKTLARCLEVLEDFVASERKRGRR
ncbi:hypothetical protein OLZ32_18860 [Rhizobium sp. 1AS11]|uniref:hypothetical protein n=1 Tax=Rhizobium acaciae TaxID=2989736 RepID=UPI0022229C51|nr:hypothetical protein [Rhizobium acaciae]MCW1410252.1 hypothetical protein [Rhizobium acaciae]MCW1742466.1 hypothetical protein [Rhizobium acaciae]